MSSCQSCPKGGTCKDNIFSKILPQSIWTQEKFLSVSDGKTNLLWRVAGCPAGFSLERTAYNPAGDTCEECPPGTYNVEGSRWSNQDAAPASFCLKCPVEGANCPVLLPSSQPNTSLFSKDWTITPQGQHTRKRYSHMLVYLLRNWQERMMCRVEDWFLQKTGGFLFRRRWNIGAPRANFPQILASCESISVRRMPVQAITHAMVIAQACCVAIVRQGMPWSLRCARNAHLATMTWKLWQPPW